VSECVCVPMLREGGGAEKQEKSETYEQV
jgi:hypothetical protein